MRELLQEVIGRQTGLTQNDRINSAILETMLRQNALLEEIDYKLDKLLPKEEPVVLSLEKEEVKEEPKKKTTTRKKATTKKTTKKEE